MARQHPPLPHRSLRLLRIKSLCRPFFTLSSIPFPHHPRRRTLRRHAPHPFLSVVLGRSTSIPTGHRRKDMPDGMLPLVLKHPRCLPTSPFSPITPLQTQPVPPSRPQRRFDSGPTVSAVRHLCSFHAKTSPNDPSQPVCHCLVPPLHLSSQGGKSFYKRTGRQRV